MSALPSSVTLVVTFVRLLIGALAFNLVFWMPEISVADDGPPIHFYADLSADEQSAVTESPGVGRVDFVLERETLRFSWVLTYSDLTSLPTGIEIYGPQTPGGNAGLLMNLAQSGLRSPVEGAAILSDGELEYLLTGRMYVNLRTTNFELGELRGQIMRQRPTE
jgi:hypothetical protein